MMNWKVLIPVCALVLSGCAGQSGTADGDMDGADGAYGDGSDGSGTQTWPDEGGSSGSTIPIGDDRAAVVMNERVIILPLTRQTWMKPP